MQVTDRETGGAFRLDVTDALNADLERHSQTECTHPDAEIRRTIVSGGAAHFRRQCQVCGEFVGQAISKTATPANCLPEDQALRERYRTERHQERDDIVQHHVKKQKIQGSEWRAVADS
jgi:hypothetical protein